MTLYSHFDARSNVCKEFIIKDIHYKIKVSTIVKMIIESLYSPENSVHLKIEIMNL
jgi:hypothetical protein